MIFIKLLFMRKKAFAIKSSLNFIRIREMYVFVRERIKNICHQIVCLKVSSESEPSYHKSIELGLSYECFNVLKLHHLKGATTFLTVTVPTTHNLESKYWNRVLYPDYSVVYERNWIILNKTLKFYLLNVRNRVAITLSFCTFHN